MLLRACLRKLLRLVFLNSFRFFSLIDELNQLHVLVRLVLIEYLPVEWARSLRQHPQASRTNGMPARNDHWVVVLVVVADEADLAVVLG